MGKATIHRENKQQQNKISKLWRGHFFIFFQTDIADSRGGIVKSDSSSETMCTSNQDQTSLCKVSLGLTPFLLKSHLASHQPYYERFTWPNSSPIKVSLYLPQLQTNVGTTWPFHHWPHFTCGAPCSVRCVLCSVH